MFRALIPACLAACLALPALASRVRRTVTGEIDALTPGFGGLPSSPAGFTYQIDLRFTFDADLNEISDVARVSGPPVTGGTRCRHHSRPAVGPISVSPNWYMSRLRSSFAIPHSPSRPPHR
jgi:hypothetical protein